MAIYELRCTGEVPHAAEVIQSFSAPLPACPQCGAPTRKLPSRVALRGQVVLPPSADRMPQTWKGTYDGDRGYLRELQRQAERRRLLEDRHPELAGDRRPVLAHEGRYENAPLRAGEVPHHAAHAHQHPHPHPAAGAADS